MADLYWKWDAFIKAHLVYADHPTLGPIYMGATMDEARTVAGGVQWLAS